MIKIGTFCASPYEKDAAVVVLPTPPFPEEMVRTLHVSDLYLLVTVPTAKRGETED